MANKSKVQSVEPDIADLVNGWLKSYGLDYKLEQASLNSEIDKALDEYHSKSGGKGGNRPDAKLLLKDKYGTFYPVLIEYKGYKDKLVKLDTDGIVDNKKDKNEPNYTNIKSYAVNGAIHYAKEKISSPEEYQEKVAKIKATQLLGLEILPQIYMLAILNMILMGDGSSNILNQDSLKNFDGNYGFSSTKKNFPATAFVLNPPYSADGNGMIFVEKALSMMENGYAAIIIQNSAGSGKAVKYNKEILKHSTLLASIKMPIDLFVGKSSVQTNIYVFKVGEPHHAKNTVKFIDFSNDGYTRTNRKKASVNLRDTDHAKERYQEIADIVRFGKSELNIFTEKEYYEGKIDPENGADWNQSAPIDTIPTLEDFKKTVSDYLAWEVSTLLKGKSSEDNERLGK